MTADRLRLLAAAMDAGVMSDDERVKSAVELRELAADLICLTRRYQWRPISELHEDYGSCVLINIDDPGHFEIGSNIDLDFEESLWTHFVRIAPLWQEEYERLTRQRSGSVHD